MTLRDRKKAATKERIAAEALRLFERQGFEGTTIDEIAEAAQVGRRTFFRYFPTKEAVVFPDWERRLGEFRSGLGAQSGRPERGGRRRQVVQEGQEGREEGLQAVRRALVGLAEDYAAHREDLLAQQRLTEGSAALLAAEAGQDRLWEAAIAEALGDRAGAGVAARRRARLAAGAVMGAIRACLKEWYQARGRINLRTLGEEAFALLEAGISKSQEGEKK